MKPMLKKFWRDSVIILSSVWINLALDEKEKDRDMVRGIPKMLARGGYAVVKTHG